MGSPEQALHHIRPRVVTYHVDIRAAVSVGSVGDADDNALVDSIIGLFKTEVVNRHGPFKTFAEVEFALMEWCGWYNNDRLHSWLDYLTPAEYEAAYYSQQLPRRPALV
ncbi:integrase core domain-containing protein [Nocardia sp. NPDC050793]|uniref:integrase core domain-containing protein n=1 Tax=Nocardia sp. NPDC050793 TaxID=3155159 RepID=UPI0033C9E8F2